MPEWLDTVVAVLTALTLAGGLVGVLVKRMLMPFLNEQMQLARETHHQVSTNHHSSPEPTLRDQISDVRSAVERFGTESIRAALVLAPLAAILVDERTMTIRMANRPAERLFGWPAGQLDGRSLEVLVPPSRRENHALHWRTFWLAPQSRAMAPGRELLAWHYSGSEFAVEIGLMPYGGDSVLAYIHAPARATVPQQVRA